MKGYSLIEQNNHLITDGFSYFTGKEFQINLNEVLKEDINLVVSLLYDYVKLSEKKIQDKETFGCGSWMIQFIFNDVFIELHELKKVVDNVNVYEFDLKFTTLFLREQYITCNENNVKPFFSELSQKIAVSSEIFKGCEVNGVRYPAPKHMTGWYLTSNNFNGDVNSLLVVHLYHLLIERPDLAKFLALPSRYRFFKDDLGQDVWFDTEIN